MPIYSCRPAFGSLRERWKTHSCSSVFAAAAMLGWTVLAGCDVSTPAVVSAWQESPRPRDAASIEQFCGDCHGVPPATSFPRDRWEHEVDQGIRLYHESGRTNLTVPDFAATVAYFSEQAPAAYKFPEPEGQADNRFTPRKLSWPADVPAPVAISHSLLLSGENRSPELAVTDLWTGQIHRVRATDSGIEAAVLGEVAQPSHIERADLNGDGIDDFLVTDLGSLSPQDPAEGTLWYFQGQSDGTFRRRGLWMGLSRAADVKPLDHDGDGDLDLAVADFGLHFEGAVYLLTNEGVEEGGLPQFAEYVLAPRPGAVELNVVDFNRDGRPDIVSLISQHHESVELYLNRGDGGFSTHVLFQARDPSFGSSGIETLDFDEDGDLDVLYTNGDTFDDDLAKPFHAVHWLENRGEFPFTHHVVDSLPGAYCATAGDLDLDGDLDVAAVSLLTPEQVADYPPGQFDGVVWFERLTDGSFRRHRVLTDVCQHATCRLVDWDLDGDLDLLTPPYRSDLEPNPELLVYENQTRQPRLKAETALPAPRGPAAVFTTRFGGAE